MSLSQKIVAALDAFPGPGTIAVEDGPYRLSLDVSAGGPVGVSMERLDFTVGGRPEWTSDALRAWGDRLAARVTYLMEPLVVVEVDPAAGEVELRSQSPSARSGQRAYYEVRLSRQGTLRLIRTAFDEESRRRRPAPCQITREALEHLADDLVASIG
jgi:hypothetical protein